MNEGPLYTLAQAASLTGLTVDALRKKVRRGKLAKVQGNDGLVRVRLTEADLASLRPALVVSSGPPPASHSEERLAVTALRDALERERERADRAEVEAGRLAGELREAGARAEGEAVARAAAEGELKGLREALAEARKPFWKRWLG